VTVQARERFTGPRVGDFVHMPDGTLRRFTYDWGDGLQTTVGAAHPCNGDASFYLGRSGEASFSGSLDSTIPRDRITLTDERHAGRFWFFHHGFPGAHQGVHCDAPCRVYRVRA